MPATSPQPTSLATRPLRGVEGYGRRAARLSTSGTIASGLLLASLVACNSYMDPSKVGYFGDTPTTMPVLKRLDVIERSNDEGDIDRGPPSIPELTGQETVEYLVSQGDQLRITLLDFSYDRGTAEVDRVVGPDGNIQLPDIGAVYVAGSSLEQVELAIKQAVKDKKLLLPHVDPRVAIALIHGKGMVFTIDGQVGQAAEYPITSGQFRLRQALALAGGTSPTTKTVYIMRASAGKSGGGGEASSGGSSSSGAQGGTSGGASALTPQNQQSPAPSPAPPPRGATPMDLDALFNSLQEEERGGAGSGAPAGGGSTLPPPNPLSTAPAEAPSVPGATGSGVSEPELPSHAPSSAPPSAPPSTPTPPPSAPPAPPVEEPDAPALGAIRVGPRAQDAGSGLLIPSAADPAVEAASSGSGYRYPSVSLDNGVSDYVYDPETQRWVLKAGAAGTQGAYDPAALEQQPPSRLGIIQRVIVVDYDKLIHGDPNQNVVIKPNDYIYVEPPPIGVVYLGGEVVRPGVFQLPTAGELTLGRAITASGGLGAIAMPEKVDLVRRIEGDREATIRVNLAAIMRRTEPDIVLKPDDHIIVGTDFWATPLAVIRNGFRATYGFGFVVDRNWGNDIFGPPPVDVTTN